MMWIIVQYSVLVLLIVSSFVLTFQVTFLDGEAHPTASSWMASTENPLALPATLYGSLELSVLFLLSVAIGTQQHSRPSGRTTKGYGVILVLHILRIFVIKYLNENSIGLSVVAVTVLLVFASLVAYSHHVVRERTRKEDPEWTTLPLDILCKTLLQFVLTWTFYQVTLHILFLFPNEVAFLQCTLAILLLQFLVGYTESTSLCTLLLALCFTNIAQNEGKSPLFHIMVTLNYLVALVVFIQGVVNSYLELRALYLEMTAPPTEQLKQAPLEEVVVTPPSETSAPVKKRKERKKEPTRQAKSASNKFI